MEYVTLNSIKLKELFIMHGELVVWGYDEDGFWKRYISCHRDDISSILLTIGNYDDYDFEAAYEE